MLICEISFLSSGRYLRCPFVCGFNRARESWYEYWISVFILLWHPSDTLLSDSLVQVQFRISMGLLEGTYDHRNRFLCLWPVTSWQRTNEVHLCWVLGHHGDFGNKKADALAPKGTESPFIGSESACGISKSVARGARQIFGQEMHTFDSGSNLQYKTII